MARQAHHPAWVSAVSAILLTLLVSTNGQYTNTSAPGGPVGDLFTKITANYNLGEPGLTAWANITQADFKQSLVPHFQAARPTSTAMWVQASTADLTFDLRLQLSGTVPKTVKVDTLYWELAKPLAAVLPGATAAITAAVVGNTTTTIKVNASISLTYKSYPPAGAPHTTTASGLVTVLRDLLTATPTAASANAAAFIRNITGLQEQPTRRVTNATLSLVVPSGYQERSITFYPLLAELTSTSLVSNTTLSSTVGKTTDGSVNFTATNNTTYSNRSTTTNGSSASDVSWQLLAMKTEDVSSFFVGRVVPYNLSTSVCDITRDSCCRDCDASKSCVKKPLCVPTDLNLTLQEQLCLVPSNIPCWQRSYACGSYWNDIAPYADRLYQYARGFWDFSYQTFWGKMWQKYGYQYNEFKCVPYRITNCIYSMEPEYCTGMCKVVEQAICTQDDCTTWDPVKKMAVTDPCCGFSGQCEKAPIPLNMTATCVWDNPSQSCRVHRVADCTLASLSGEERVLCQISNIMTINAGKNLTEVANNLCSGTVTNLCTTTTSSSCKFCQQIQAKLQPAMGLVAEGARFCKANGDASPHYGTTGVYNKQALLLKSALSILLESRTTCNMAADALMPGSGPPLLSAANVAAHGGAWICNATTRADQLCDNGGSYNSSEDSSGNTMVDARNYTGSHTDGVTMISNTTTANNPSDGYMGAARNCSTCGAYVEEFAAAVAAGTYSYQRADVQSFCMGKNMQEYQAAIAAGQPDDFVEDICAINWERYNWCDPESGCGLKTQCQPSYQSASMDNLACSNLSTNGSACNQKPECVFVPTAGNDDAAECARIAYAVRQSGLQQLTRPLDACQWYAGNIPSTCGNACRPEGYCNTTGVADPQCTQACSRCKKCVASVDYVRDVLNISTDDYMYAWGYSPANAFKAYKVCMLKAATAGSKTAPTGHCMAQEHAYCSLAPSYFQCGQLSGCQQTQACKRIDTHTCEASTSTASGVACKVATLCEQMLGSAQVLPAATLCGPQYLDACTLSSTSPACAKCLRDADSLQQKLRTLANFQCRRPTYYMQTQVQQCTKFISGWFNGKDSCLAAIKLWPQFQQQAANSSSGYSTYGMYGYYNYYDSNQYAGFCSSFQDVSRNKGSLSTTTSSRRLLSTLAIEPTQMRKLLQAGQTPPDHNHAPVDASPVPYSGPYSPPPNNTTPGYSPQPYGGDNNGTYGGQDNPPYGPGMPCQDCNKAPAWVYDLMAPDAQSACFTQDNLTFCRMDEGATLCGGDAANCSMIITCPEAQVIDCMDPLRRPQLAMLPLLQLEAPEAWAQLVWESKDAASIINKLEYSNYLPEDAVRIADRLIHWEGSFPYTPKLPYGFGCPDWPPVMEAMGVQPAWPSTPDTLGGDNTTTNSTNPQRSMCWVDAAVAMNLMVGSMLETYFPVQPTTEGVNYIVRPPYSSPINWTVYWMPPNLRCESPDMPGCLNQTFKFQLENWVPCDSLAGQVNDTSSLQRVLQDNTTDNGTTEYCRYNPLMEQLATDPMYNYNPASFSPDGLLGLFIQQSACQPAVANATHEEATDNTTTFGSDMTPPTCPQQTPPYPVGDWQLPEVLFAMPFSSYDPMGAVLSLQRVAGVNNTAPGQPWCTRGVQPCNDAGDGAYVDPGTSTPFNNSNVFGNYSVPVPPPYQDNYNSTNNTKVPVPPPYQDYNNSNNSMPMPPPCQDCNKGPAWTYQVTGANTTGVCVYNGTTTCQVVNGTASCQTKDVTNCTSLVKCPYTDPLICLKPLMHQAPMMPLRQVEGVITSSYTTWTSQNPENGLTLSYSSFLPEEAVRLADKLVRRDGGYGFTPQLPHGFGCPDWPPVMEAMGLNVPNISAAGNDTTVNSTVSNNNHTSTMCWVDATVAMNLMVGQMLSNNFWCGSPDAEGANPPYTACSNWTVYWMPPNLPCGPDNRAACLNHTFSFQLDQWAACDSILDRVNDTSNLEKWVSGPDEATNGTEYCRYDVRYAPWGGYSSGYYFNYATFSEQGPLGPMVRAPFCSTTNSSTPGTTSLGCLPAAFYPIGTDQLPEPLFAMPFSSYDVATDMSVLKRAANVSVETPGWPWCPAGVQRCVRYTPPPYVPYFDIYNNGNEGYFQAAYNYNTSSNSSALSYTYVAYNNNPGSYVDDYSAYWYFMRPSLWSSDEWTCRYALQEVTQLTRAGYIANDAAGLYEACVDYSTSRGDPNYRKILWWSSQASCSTWSDSCCSDVGLKPGNKAVCEAHSSCSFSASCTVSQDNCYEQFRGSLSNTTNYAICDPSCSFQPLVLASGGAVFSALPTLRTGNGTVAIQQGICYNKTVWDTCATKSSEATCKLWVGGNDTCAWTPTCKPPAATQFSCQSNTDSCCLDSTTATFNAGQKTTCTAQQGGGGKPCKVDKQCYLLLDPCASRSTPWDCLANTTCQFVPSQDSMMGGTCRTVQQYDPCVGLTATTCSSNPACTMADRCVTDRCPDSTDTCCALAGKDAACSADPTCLPTTTCLPATDECAVYSNSTTCATNNFCRWEAMQLPSGAFPPNNMTNMTSSNGPSSTGNNTTPGPVNSVGDNNGTQFNASTMGFCVMDVSKHPCSVATNTQTCYGMVDAVGRPRCFSQGNCLSACSRCADCLSELTTSFAQVLAQLNGSAATDANKVSNTFSSWCYSKGVEAAVCDTVASAIAFSRNGNLARRPGMLCTLAGRCTRGCTVPVRNASGVVTSKQPLSLCTDTGTTAGTPVPQNVSKGSSCLTDSDCTGTGVWCDLGSALTEVCTCVDGKDVCSIMGTCNSDICPRLTGLTTINKDLSGCADNSQCTAGLVCQSKLYQTYSCSNSIVTATNHSGYCAEAAPGLLSAMLDDSAASITVALSAPAAGFVSGCSAIFTAATMAKLGSKAICAVDYQKPELKQMLILLQDVPSLIWGTDKLEVRANQTTLVSSMGSRPFAGASTAPVASCTNCPSPIAILSGPKLVTKPCIGSDVADFTAVYFDASGSLGSAAAPVTGVAWELVRGTSVNISAALDRLASKADVRDKMVLKLDGSILQNTDADIYSLAITVTNSLGGSSSAMTTFVVADAGSTPSISVFAPGNDASGTVSVGPSKGLKLQSKLQIDSVCKGSASKVNYRWTCSAADSSACTLPAEAAAYKQLMLDPTSLIGFKLDLDYTFTLTAGFTGSAATSTASMGVRFARSPLRADLSGPMGDVPLTKTFTLDASKSSDPDNPAASLKYDFSCSPQPCFSDMVYTGVRAKQSSWTVDASKLAVINQEYTFTVTVSGTAAGDTRQASASLSVTPKPGNPPTGVITRFCGYDTTSNPLPCPAKHNPTQDLVVTLKLDADFKDASVLWMVGGDMQQALQDGANAKGVRKSTLTVRPSAFPTAGSAKLLAIMTMPGINGTASISVPLNTPPSCPQAPCFFTDTTSTVFPAYTFVGTASGWQDADGDVLTYEFGQVVDGGYVSRDPAGASTTYVFKGFEPGTYQLYSCAIDTSGARTCATASIEVLQPPPATAEQKAAMVDGTLGKIDVEQLASTGDVSAVTDAMQEFASIAAFATAPASPTSDSGGTGTGSGSNSSTDTSGGSTTATTTPAPALSPVMVEKQNALLTTLSTLMNIKDPAAMGSSMNAADKVSDAGTAGLSEKAGGALLDVVDGFLSAATNSMAAGVTDSQVKTAAKVLIKGLKAAFKSDTTAHKHRRSLLSLSSSGSAAYTRLTNSLTGLVTLTSAGTPTGSTKVVGSTDICMAVTRDSGVGGGFDAKEVTLDCSSTAATSSSSAGTTTADAGHRRRSLLTAVQGSVSFTMPSGFSTACAADPVCSQADSTAVSQVYVADAASTLAMVRDWPAASLVTGADSSAQLTAISGVLTFSMGSKTSGPICSTTVSCTATITLPVAGFNPIRSTACLRLDPLTGDATALLQASTTGVAVVPASITSSSVTCTSDSWGKVVVVQYTATRTVDTPVDLPVDSNSTSPAPDTTGNTTTTNSTNSTTVQASPSPSPAPHPSPSPSPSNDSNAGPQLGTSENVTYAGVDNSTLAAADAGEPIAFTFRFSNYNYSAMFMSGDSVNSAEVAAFQLAVKESFLAGIAAKTNLTVVTADNKLQLNRVNILDMRQGSVIIDLEFLPPATASLADITTMKSVVSSSTADFFATPGFIAAYGTPTVTGQVLEGYYRTPAVSQAVAIGIGVGLGVGGALLLLGALGLVVRRRRTVARLNVMDAAAVDGAGAGQAFDPRTHWPVLQEQGGV